MLAAIRKFAKSWVAAVLIGLLIVSFAVFGINDIFQSGFSNAVVVAGDHEISQADYRRQFDNFREQASERQGSAVTSEQLVEAGVHTQLLEQLASQASIFEWARRAGIIVADQLIVDAIREQPAFFNRISGAFDQQQYQARLAEVGLTEAVFEQSLRDDLAANHFLTGAVAGMRAPRIYGAMQAAYGLETRDASWFTVDQRVVGATPQPTDAQLTAFMGELEQQLRRPELRAMTVVLFTPATQAAQVQVSEAELRERYEFQKDSLSQPETRSFVQITAPNAAAAQRIAAALRAGQDPAAVARANNVEPVEYENRPRSSVVDRAVAAAAFSLNPGQVSDPIQGELGSVVVKVTGVTPGRETTFEEARPQIEAELRREGATERVYELVQQYETAREGGASLVEAARQVGVETVDLPPITAQGVAANGQRLGAPQALFDAAFALPEGGESDIEDAGNGEYFAVRVNDVLPSAMPELDDVRSQLTQIWIQRETGRRLQARADELAERIRGGETIQAVAASAGASVQTRTGIGRDDAGELGQALVGRLFAAGRAQPFTAQTEQGVVVGRVDAVRGPAPVLAARPAEQRRPAITLDLYRELSEMAESAARARVAPKIYPNRARTALGLEPEPATPTKK